MKEYPVQRAAALKPLPDPDMLVFGKTFTDHMFLMDYTAGQGWHDGRIVPYAPLALEPSAMVFHYAQEVFEGLKAYRSPDGGVQLFRPMENVRRINSSCERMCIPQLPEEDTLAAIEQLVRVEERWVPAKPGTSLYIRPFVIATTPSLGVHAAHDYIFCIITCPVGAYYKEGINPVRIYVEDEYVRAAPGGTGAVKCGGNYAASLLSPSCETLRGVFMGMLDNNEKLLAGVENASVEIGYGFTGWIEHRRVLLGSREMMKRHDIEVPSLDYEKKYTKNGQRSPIYLAVAGKLFGMFLVSYRPDRRAAETLDSLAQSGISVLVQADDFNITAPLVAATYGIPEGTVKVLSQHEQDALETELAYRPESEGVMMHTGACASFLGGMRAAARAAAGERLAGVVQTAAVALGAVLSVALGFYEGLTGLSLGTVLAYQLVWCAIIASVPFAKKP